MYPETLELFILPEGQDIVVTASAPLEQTTAQLHTWLWQRGYQAVGQPFLTWNSSAQRELHQPIVPRFAIPIQAAYTVQQRPELLVVAIPVPVRAGAYNLAGLYDMVCEYQLEPIGAPFIPLQEKPHPAVGTVTGYMPVVPQGTRALIPLNTRLSQKIGLLAAPPEPGQLLPESLAWQQVRITVLRTMIIFVLAAIVSLPILGVCSWLVLQFGGRPISNIMVSSVLVGMGFGLSLAIAMIIAMLRKRRQAVKHWNAFWQLMPTPSLLVFYEAENGLSSTNPSQRMVD